MLTLRDQRQSQEKRRIPQAWRHTQWKNHKQTNKQNPTLSQIWKNKPALKLVRSFPYACSLIHTYEYEYAHICKYRQKEHSDQINLALLCSFAHYHGNIIWELIFRKIGLYSPLQCFWIILKHLLENMYTITPVKTAHLKTLLLLLAKIIGTGEMFRCKNWGNMFPVNKDLIRNLVETSYSFLVKSSSLGRTIWPIECGSIFHPLIFFY